MICPHSSIIFPCPCGQWPHRDSKRNLPFSRPQGICSYARVLPQHPYAGGFVKLLRLRRSSGERVLLPASSHPLSGLLRTCHFGPTRESFPHLLTIVGR